MLLGVLAAMLPPSKLLGTPGTKVGNGVQVWPPSVE
jgi:hypothetical protein